MIKKLVKVGDRHALILDQAILDAMGLREGDEVQLTLRDRTITVCPIASVITDEQFDAAAADVFDRHGEALRRLA